MTESELKKGQDVLDFIAAHGGPKMKAVPLEREADGPALPRGTKMKAGPLDEDDGFSLSPGLRSAIDALKRDAIRLCDRLDRVASGHPTEVIREHIKEDGDAPWAGQAALRLRNRIARDVHARRRASRHGEAGLLHDEALRRADALVDRLLLCAALASFGQKQVEEDMALIKDLWTNAA